jgi:uncharacterized protein (TIGR02001 family)
MAYTNTFVRTLGTAGIALMALSGPSVADDKFSWYWTVTGASDYMFRGISFTGEDPTINSYVELDYNTGSILGTAYAAFWTSNIDSADIYGPWEQDIYVGIRPVTGPISWDMAVWYYLYGAKNDSGLNSSDLDYFEFTIGASVTPIKNLTVGAKGYYTPDQDLAVVETYTVEGTAAYTLPAVGIFTPTISGLYGYSEAESGTNFFLGEDDYTYWNAGLKLAVEKFTFDFRYWDTSIDNDLADERFVFSAAVTLP